MSRRAEDVGIICCPISAAERAVLGVMRSAQGGGWTSDANMMRSALWSLADHMGIDPPDGCFDQRAPNGDDYKCHIRQESSPDVEPTHPSPDGRPGGT